jgi:ABC-type sulfate/molybdate transport systems ATPase subunit
MELELLDLQRECKCSMLLVTHDLAEGYKLGAKVAVYHEGRIAQCGTRQQVFLSPVNRTVARLTGVRNFMDGEICRIEPPYVWVQIAAWETQLKAVLPSDKELAAGRKVVVGIRPEFIQIAQKESSENVLASRVLQVVEGISNMTYRFAVESDQQEQHLLNVLISKSDDTLLHEDHMCQLYLPPAHLIVIPE